MASISSEQSDVHISSTMNPMAELVCRSVSKVMMHFLDDRHGKRSDGLSGNVVTVGGSATGSTWRTATTVSTAASISPASLLQLTNGFAGMCSRMGCTFRATGLANGVAG